MRNARSVPFKNSHTLVRRGSYFRFAASSNYVPVVLKAMKQIPKFFTQRRSKRKLLKCQPWILQIPSASNFFGFFTKHSFYPSGTSRVLQLWCIVHLKSSTLMHLIDDQELLISHSQVRDWLSFRILECTVLRGDIFHFRSNQTVHASSHDNCSVLR